MTAADRAASGLAQHGNDRPTPPNPLPRLDQPVAGEAASESRGPLGFLSPMPNIDFGYGLTAWAKMEGFTESKSHKIRAARWIVRELQASGQIGFAPAMLLLSSSGRAAQAFAHATAGIENVGLHIISDVLSPRELLDELDRFPHVRKTIVNNPDRTGSHLAARLSVIDDLMARQPNSIVIDQYGDPRFPEAYLATLVPEVIAQAAGSISAIFVPTGTGALIRAFDLDKKLNERGWPIIPVDAEGSGLFRASPRGAKRRFSGYGNSSATALIRECGALEAPIHVPDLAVVRMAHWLLQAGLCVGASSAAVAAAFVHASYREHPALMRSGSPVLIFPDDGEAYRTTLFNMDWLARASLGKATF